MRCPGRAAPSCVYSSAAPSATFHATYELRVGDELTSRIEVWQRGHDVRADSNGPDGTRLSSVFTDARRTVSCDRPDGAWTCRLDPSARGGFERFVADAVNDLRGLDIAASDATIAGVSARCYDVSGADGLQICATTSGVPARMKLKTSTMELTELDSSVTAADFRLPAPVE